MSRFIILTLLIVCFVCIYQAYAAPADVTDDASKTVSDWTDTVKNKIKELQPGFEKFGADTKNFFKDTYESLSEKLKKVITKTD